METIKTNSPSIINWLKDYDNQVYLFCMTIFTIPLLISDYTSVFVMKICFILWLIGAIIVTSLWQRSKKPCDKNRIYAQGGSVVSEDNHYDELTKKGYIEPQIKSCLQSNSKTESVHNTGDIPKYPVGEWVQSENKYYLQCKCRKCNRYFFGAKNKLYCSAGCKIQSRNQN